MPPPRPASRPKQADWSVYAPAGRRLRVRLERQLRLFSGLVSSRSSVMLGLLVIYLLICLAVFRSTAGSVAILALSPLILTPALALLVYWLVWSDYHR